MYARGLPLKAVKKMHNVIAVNDEMVTVKTANKARKKMTVKQLKAYLKSVVPFEKDGRWPYLQSLPT